LEYEALREEIEQLKAEVSGGAGGSGSR